MSKKSPFGSVTFCEYGQLKGWKPRFPPTVAKSSIKTQIRNLRQRNGIFCKHNTSIMHSWWSILSLSGTCFWYRLDAWNSSAWMWNKHVEQICFRQCFTFCEHRQLKAWQPHFPPTVAKAQSWLIATAWQMGKIFSNKPWRPQLRDQTYTSLHETHIRNLRQKDGIFCKLNTNIIQSWWSVLPLSATLSFW